MRRLRVYLDDVYRDRRVLLTGHTGFKGAWLAIWLKRLGAKVTGLALDPPTEPALYDRAEVDRDLDDVRVDLRDGNAVAAAVSAAAPEIVFHLAAQSLVRLSYDEPLETLDVNVLGTARLLEALRGIPSVKAVVVVTSDKCYANREWDYGYRETDPLGGHDLYSASKAGAEIVAAAYRDSFLRECGVRVATARAGNVIGGGDWAADRIIPDAARALAEDGAVPVRNPASTRPWQHVLEPLGGYLQLGHRLLAEGGERFAEAWNFGPSAESVRPVSDLVSAFVSAYGTGSWADVSAGQARQPHEAGRLALAWEKARSRLGWAPRWGFSEAVGRTADWYRRHGAGESARDLCLNDIEAYTA